MKIKNNEEGQSLIEVLASLVIAILIIGALINAVTASIRNAQFAKNSSLATKYAQEGMEFIRSQRDTANTWVEFRDGRVRTFPWCLKSTAWPEAVGYCGEEDKITGTIFTREAYISEESDTKVKAKVIVKWKDQSSQEHKSELVSIFSDMSQWK